FDDYDIRASVKWCELALNIPDKKLQAEKKLTQLFQKGAKTHLITSTYVNMLVERGRGGAEVLLAYPEVMIMKNAPPPESAAWQLFWDSGKGFNPSESKRVTLGKISENKFTIELLQVKSIKKIRLDFPPGINLQVNRLEILDESGDYIDILSLPDLSLHQVRRQANVLDVFQNNDPYIFWPITSEPKEIRMTLSSLLPAWVIKLFHAKQAMTIYADLMKADQKELAEWFHHGVLSQRALEHSVRVER
ncbi:MAG: hypothetical protein R8M38_08600, partial [Mariprofundaceae bacterium]